MMGSWILCISIFFRYWGSISYKYFLAVCRAPFHCLPFPSSFPFLRVSSRSSAILELPSSSDPPASAPILELQQALLLLTILSVIGLYSPPPKVQLFYFLFCCLCLWNHTQTPPKLMSWSFCLMFSPESFTVSWRLSCWVLCHLVTS